MQVLSGLSMSGRMIRLRGPSCGLHPEKGSGNPQMRGKKYINVVHFTLVFTHSSFIENTPEMNESARDFWHSIFYRIKKFDLKKKLELTEGSFWTTFWKYHDQHSIGKPIEITTSRLGFALISQCNADHGISKILSGKYLPLVLTFF